MRSENGFVELALLRVAVSGHFDPLALLSEIPSEQHDAVIGALSLVCDEEIVNDRLVWTLQAAIRRQQLARLDRPASVKTALDGAPAAEADDVFATTLRRLLLGEDIVVPPARTAKDDSKVDDTLATEEAARHSALQFAAFAPVVDADKCKADFAASRGRIAERQQQASIAIVLPDKLYGRTAEVERLLRFATGKMKDTRPMLVTGIAGVGKSAVLAAVLKRQLKRGHAAIQIDFDRPDLSDAGPLPIVREIMRQLELSLLRRTPAEPSMQKVAKVLSAVRHGIRSFELQQTQRATVASQFSYILSAVYPPLLHDIDESMRAMPVLLVLDTFEVVGSLGSDAVNRVLRLEADLRELTELKSLRTIVSSRGVPLTEADSVVGSVTLPGAVSAFGPPTRRITIEGLADADGGDLLAARDRNRRFLAEKDRQRLSRALKGHPMALLVLERFARERSAAEIDELVIDIESNPDFNADFAQAFVYTRILERLTDPEIKRLAHPGLVLRRVTPDLIRLVLAGPCELGTMDQARAEALFDRLQGHYWLVEAVQPGIVRHCPDLRRMMLPGMFAGPLADDTRVTADQKQKVRMASLAVCTAAADFYRTGPAKGDDARTWWENLSPLEREVEATYYQALSGATAPLEIDSGFAADLRSGIGGDFETLPVPWRGLIKATLGDFHGLSDSERASLTGRLREAAESVEIEQQLKSGKTGDADERAAEEVQRREMSNKLNEAQALLTALGIDAGRTDGVAGPSTAQAIRVFQSQQGLAVDGRFDDAVLEHLRMEFQKVHIAAVPAPGALGNEEELRPLPTAQGDVAPGRDSLGPDGAPVLISGEPVVTGEGQGSDLALSEQQVRAAFDQLNFKAARLYAGPVAESFAKGLMSEPALRESNAGQLWSTGLWEAMLALKLEGAPTPPFEAFISAEYLDTPSSVGVLSAALLIGRLTVPMQAHKLRRRIQSNLLPRFEFRLRSVDGLRHAALLMSDPEIELDRSILFDASALSLAEPKLSEHLAGVASCDRLLALDFDTDRLRPFAEALATGRATAADFESAYTCAAVVRWPPRDQDLSIRIPPIASASLRGLTPELHEPAARLIEGLSDNDAVMLAEAIASESVHWPSDLWFQPIVETEIRTYGFSEIQSPRIEGDPDFLAHDRRSYDPRLALTVVQSADRCGVLRFALSALALRDSRGKLLLNLHDIVTNSFFALS
jgi:peptidoglycan hydrolase-like protein with peptidoglycan-binding domain